MRSRGSLEGVIGGELIGRRCDMSTYKSNLRTVTCVSVASCSNVVLSVVLPKGSKCRVLERLERQRSSAPILLLATGSDVRSHIEKLSLNTSSCLVGPFTFRRLLTEVHIVVHEGPRFASGRLGVTSLVLSHSAEGIAETKGRVSLSTGRFVILRYLVHGGGVMVAERRVRRGT